MRLLLAAPAVLLALTACGDEEEAAPAPTVTVTAESKPTPPTKAELSTSCEAVAQPLKDRDFPMPVGDKWASYQAELATVFDGLPETHQDALMEWHNAEQSIDSSAAGVDGFTSAMEQHTANMEQWVEICVP